MGGCCSGGAVFDVQPRTPWQLSQPQPQLAPTMLGSGPGSPKRLPGAPSSDTKFESPMTASRNVEFELSVPDAVRMAEETVSSHLQPPIQEPEVVACFPGSDAGPSLDTPSVPAEHAAGRSASGPRPTAAEVARQTAVPVWKRDQRPPNGDNDVYTEDVKYQQGLVCGLACNVLEGSCAKPRGRIGAASNIKEAGTIECPGVTLERLTRTLFSLHDLNDDGVLSESELIRLNETVAALHEEDADMEAVHRKFSGIFRKHLDPEGRPVPYSTFRCYLLRLLNDIDRNEQAQEMIVEQFIAEAQLARAVASRAQISVRSSQFPLEMETGCKNFSLFCGTGKTTTPASGTTRWSSMFGLCREAVHEQELEFGYVEQ